MARHVVKITLLLISGLITAGLLSFMLLSDNWITVNTQKLNEIETKFEENFQVYTGHKVIKAQDLKTVTEPAVKLNKQVVVKSTTSPSTSTTTTTTTKLAVTTTITNKYDELDHSDLNEHEEETNDENESSNDDTESLDYEPEDNSNAKRQKRSDDQSKYIFLKLNLFK